MSNTHAYSTLGQRERLDLIRNGNKDAYDYEKSNNATLRKAQQDAGVSTTAVDEWDATIDNAYSKSVENAKKAVLPKFASDRLSALNNQLSASIKALKKQKNESIKQTEQEAERARAYLKEWLVNSGYSEDGKLSTESVKQLEDAIKNALDSVNSDYEEQLKSIRRKFLSMV